MPQPRPHLYCPLLQGNLDLPNGPSNRPRHGITGVDEVQHHEDESTSDGNSGNLGHGRRVLLRFKQQPPEGELRDDQGVHRGNGQGNDPSPPGAMPADDVGPPSNVSLKDKVGVEIAAFKRNGLPVRVHRDRVAGVDKDPVTQVGDDEEYKAHQAKPNHKKWIKVVDGVQGMEDGVGPAGNDQEQGNHQDILPGHHQGSGNVGVLLHDGPGVPRSGEGQHWVDLLGTPSGVEKGLWVVVKRRWKSWAK